MLYFPQLLLGAAAQFPAAKSSVRRTIVNDCPDGHTVKLADPAASTVQWRLEFRGLTDEEWNSIESLFHAIEGRLGSFTFLDPTDNLLSWSEDLSATAWAKDPLLQLTSGVSDPLGTERATRITNGSASPLVVEQALNIPGWYQYCFSVYARSDQATDIWLLWRTTASEETRAFGIGPAWKRVEHSAKLADASEVVNWGIEVQAGQTVDVFGFQLEAQLGASAYRKTLTRSGVYPEAALQDDSLSVITEGPNQHACVLRIRAQGQD